MECLRCGTCCVAPDISTLGKRMAERCRHLTEAFSCSIYDERPAVCRGYRPDELCRMIEGATIEERVARYLKIFGDEGGDREGQPAGVKVSRVNSPSSHCA